MNLFQIRVTDSNEVAQAAGVLSSRHRCFHREKRSAIQLDICVTVGVTRKKPNTMSYCFKDSGS